MEQTLKNVMQLIQESNSIYVVSHISPDGDAIGSLMAMYLALKDMNKDVHVIIPSCSDRFSFLDELKFAEEKIEADSYDLCVVLDASSVDRIAIAEEEYNRAKRKVIIDHHQNLKLNADVVFSDSSSPATCQMIYELFEFSDVNITKEIAKYIYMGILTDTGSFNYQNTTPRTHRIIANLLETGIDFAYICKMVNDTMKEERLRLVSYVINNMETYMDGKIKYTKVPFSVINSLGLDEEDAEGMVNYLRCVKGVQVAIYAREQKDGIYRVSMRSNGNVDISKAAIELGGGGHKNAAGFTVNEEIDKVKNEIIELVGVNL